MIVAPRVFNLNPKPLREQAELISRCVLHSAWRDFATR